MIALEQSDIVIVGLVRDAQSTIQIDIEKITFAFQSAKSIKWLILESDSRDDTVNEIEALSETFSINLIKMGDLEPVYPKRTERIAKCRNEYLRILQSDPKYKDVSYIIIADLDGVNSLLNFKNVEECFNAKISWDACFPNQVGPYYDIWALRHPQWCASDCWKETNFYRSLGMSQFQSEKIAVSNKMIKIPEDAAPIQVTSAFGGLGIYKKKAIEGCSYVGTCDDKSEICEHVHFHAEMVEKGMKLFILPAFINNDYNEHTRNLIFPRTLYRHIINILKSILR